MPTRTAGEASSEETAAASVRFQACERQWRIGATMFESLLYVALEVALIFAVCEGLESLVDRE